MSKVRMVSGSVDDLFVDACSAHLERMSNGHYWLGLTLPNGETIDIDIAGTRRVDALLREGVAHFGRATQVKS